jgi:FkbM family methyltransferase
MNHKTLPTAGAAIVVPKHTRMIKLTTSWLFKEPEEGIFIPLDKMALIILKIIYLTSRILLRVALGKKRSGKLYSEGRFNIFFNDYFSASLYLYIFFYKVIKFLRLDDSRFKLMKISVPKYNYKLYCRLNTNDFTTHENEIIEHFCPKEGDVVVDIGAHIGRYTIISSKRVGPNGKVIAIEANPENYEMLKKNIQLNGLTNVTALNYAINSKEEESRLKLYLPGEEVGYTIYNTIMTNRANPIEDKFVEVDAATLDNLLLLQQQQQNGIGHEQVNWIKIDVEGAEFEVLKGATNVLSKSKDIALLIEVHNLHDGTNHYKDIIEFLSFYEFKIEFEKTHESGERHIILRKATL